MFKSSNDMPLFPKADIAKNEPVQKGPSPFSRAMLGRLTANQVPSPINPSMLNRKKYKGTIIESKHIALYSTPPSFSRSLAVRPWNCELRDIRPFERKNFWGPLVMLSINDGLRSSSATKRGAASLGSLASGRAPTPTMGNTWCLILFWECDWMAIWSSSIHLMASISFKLLWWRISSFTGLISGAIWPKWSTVSLSTVESPIFGPDLPSLAARTLFIILGKWIPWWTAERFRATAWTMLRNLVSKARFRTKRTVLEIRIGWPSTMRAKRIACWKELTVDRLT